MSNLTWSRQRELSRVISDLQSLPDKHDIRLKIVKRLCPELISIDTERYKFLDSSKDHELIIISRIIERLVDEEYDGYVADCKTVIRDLASKISEVYK